MGKREDYIDKLAAQLKVWSAEIDVLEAKAERATVEVKIAILKEVEILNKKIEDAQKKIKEQEKSCIAIGLKEAKERDIRLVLLYIRKKCPRGYLLNKLKIHEKKRTKRCQKLT